MPPVDLEQFRQWLVFHQDLVFTDLLREEQQSQEDLLKTLCGHLKHVVLAQATAVVVPVATSSSYFHLAKLMAEHDIKTFLAAFETNAAAVAWP